LSGGLHQQYDCGEDIIMGLGRSALLWIIGVPIPVIILLWFFMR
jgi:hypothetical protein